MALKKTLLHLINHWCRLKENQTQGSAAIEFAIIAPAFFLLFIGIFELGAIMFVKTSMETAILQVSRFGRTGDTVKGQTIQQTAQSLVADYSFGLLDPSKLILTVTPYPNFASMPLLQDAPDDGSQNFGSGDQLVLYTLSYDWDLFTPLVAKLLSPNGKSVKLKASTVVVNEPY